LIAHLQGGPMHGKQVALQHAERFFYIAKALDVMGSPEYYDPWRPTMAQGVYERHEKIDTFKNADDQYIYEWNGWIGDKENN